jgi:hypothetical protein
MSFVKSSNLVKEINAFASTQKKQQSVLTQLIANVVYQSIAGSNADQGIKLIGAMMANGYNRTNDTITYLTKMGNFKWSKKDGLQFKSVFPRTEEMALEMAEKCVANPMFTIVKETKVQTEIDVYAVIKNAIASIERKIKEAAAENRPLKVEHFEKLAEFKAMLPA